MYQVALEWWGQRELNPHALRHMILSHARLPFRHVPSLASIARTNGIGKPSLATDPTSVLYFTGRNILSQDGH